MMIFSTLASVLALASFASAAAPAVTYPHAGITWENTWYHNVTWTPQSGTGNIQLSYNGQVNQLKSNVDLTTGRTVVQVPGGAAHASGYVVQIVAGGDTSSSAEFAIGAHAMPAPASGSSSSMSMGSMSMSGMSASLAPSASSALSSITASAASAASSVLSGAMSSSASAASATGSIMSSASSALNSVSASIASESASVLSSISAAGASAESSITSKAASAVSSATAPASTSGKSSGASPLGVSAFGVAVAAGLMAVTTLSGAFML